MRSEALEHADADSLVGRWGLRRDTAMAVLETDRIVRCWMAACGVRWPGLYIISGYRTRPVESSLSPDRTPARRSLHMARQLGQPASLAVDLRVGNLPASTTPDEIWGLVASAWKLAAPGGRWGGEFTDPDVNHFDMGGL